MSQLLAPKIYQYKLTIYRGVIKVFRKKWPGQSLLENAYVRVYKKK